MCPRALPLNTNAWLRRTSPYLRTGAGWRCSAAAFGSPPALESATVGDAPYSHLALVFVYVSAAIVWLYALDGPVWALAFAVFHVAIGIAGGSWWYVLLPAVLGPLAIRTESTGDAGPGLAFALFIVAPMGFVSSRSAWDCGGSPGSAATPRLDAIGRPRRSLPVDERHRSRSSRGSSRRTGRRPIRPRSRVLFPTGARAMRSDASVSTQLPAEVPDCLPDRGDVRRPSPPRGLM